jgi:hypothetical protein
MRVPRCWFALCLFLAFVALLIITPTWAKDPVAAYHAIRRASFKGIEPVEVVVAAKSEAGCRQPSTEELENTIEAQLHEAGIPISPDAASYLFVSLNSLAPITDALCVLAVSVDLQQAVALVRDLRITTLGTIWQEGGVGVTTTENHGEFLQMMLAAVVREFIHAYFDQNPKP